MQYFNLVSVIIFFLLKMVNISTYKMKLKNHIGMEKNQSRIEINR